MTSESRRSIGGLVSASKGKLRERRERRVEEDREFARAHARTHRKAGHSIYFRTIWVDDDNAVAERLAIIEAEGWRLETAGYAYVPQSGWTSNSGDSSDTTYRGDVQGHFTFRPSGSEDH